MSRDMSLLQASQRPTAPLRAPYTRGKQSKKKHWRSKNGEGSNTRQVQTVADGQATWADKLDTHYDLREAHGKEG